MKSLDMTPRGKRERVSEEWKNGLFKAFPIYDEITREGAVLA